MKYFMMYSAKRDIMYMNDEDLTGFWSHYLRYRYPNDRWIMCDTDSLIYRELQSTMSNNQPAKIINIHDSTSKTSRKLVQEMHRDKENYAKSYMKSENDIPEFIFSVIYSYRNEPNIVYIGKNIRHAMDALTQNKIAETVEVYLEGKYIDSLYSMMEYQSLIDRYKENKTKVT